MENKALVSVVLTSYNHKTLLERSLYSLLLQTYSPIEIIVVDDGSTDGSRAWIEEQAAKYPEKIRYFFQAQNVGIPKNKNTGYRLAKGDFVTYLDGDDIYFPGKIEKEMEVFQQNPALDVVYSNFEFWDETGNGRKIWASSADEMPVGKVFDKVARREFPGGIIFRFELMRRHVLVSNDYYDESLRIYEDWDLKIRYSSKHLIGYNPLVSSAYIVNSNSVISGAKSKELSLQMLRVLDKNKDMILHQKVDVGKLKLSLERGLLLVYLTDLSAISRIGQLVRYLSKHPFDLELYKWLLTRFAQKKK